MKGQLKVNDATNKLTTVLFIIYLIALSWILLFKLGVRFAYMDKRSVNLVPFSESPILNGENISNAVIFIPLGIYASLLFQKWIFSKKIFFFFLVSLFVEGFQFILAIGAFDITDIITNTSGGLIGLMIYKTIEKAFNDTIRAQKFISLIAAIGTVIMILMLVSLKMNMLPVRYQ